MLSNSDQVMSLKDYLVNFKQMDMENQNNFEKENKSFQNYDSNMSSVGYAKVQEQSQNYKLEIMKLKQNEAKNAQLILLMQKQIEIYYKMTNIKPEQLKGQEQMNSSDLQIQVFQKQWEADKDCIMMKVESEKKQFKQKIKELLGQIKELQIKLQEQKKSNRRMTDSMSDSNKMLDSMTSLKENNNYFNMNQSNQQLIQIQQENLELKNKKIELEKQLKDKQFTKSRMNAMPVQKLASIKQAVVALKNELKYIKNTLNIENKNQLHQITPFLVSLVKEIKLNSTSSIQTFKQQYLDEVKLRKKYYNEIQELKGNIRVTCRMRPLMKGEKNTQIQIQDDQTLKIENTSTEKVYQFEFDKICSPDIIQKEFFEEVKPLITSLLDGYNVCIFAYGATGTGKTYTMQGTPEQNGVFQRTVNELFRLKQERKDNYQYQIDISLLEIYNENIRDLLSDNQNSNKKLEIKIGQNGNYVPDLTTIQVRSPQEVSKYLDEGSLNRSVGKTNLNEHSSRSHLVYTITVYGQNNVDKEQFSGKLHLIDLAGSERLSKSKVQGDVQKESICINKSLSALSDVISARSQKNSHIPFRNSTLTYFLQDSLSGDSKTLMILQLSPSDSSIDETISSLKFAQRVKTVELGKVKKNIKPKMIM